MKTWLKRLWASPKYRQVLIEEKRLYEIARQRIELSHFITFMLISMAEYVGMKESGEISDENDSRFQKLQTGFAENKENALNCLELIRGLGATFPGEFDAVLASLDINAYDQYEDIFELGKAFTFYSETIQF